MDIKLRAWNELADGGEMVTEENSGLKSYQILERFSIVMRSTGMTTSFDEEVYEDDYISNNLDTDKQVVRQVVMENGCWMANVVSGKTRMGRKMLLHDLIKLNFKVVGNVHAVSVF